MLSILLPLLVLGGCDREFEQEEAHPPFEPTVTTLHRLTAPQWRNSAEDLVGVRYTGPLPADYALHGYERVGASEATFSPLELEQVEYAAWKVAREAVPDDAAATTLAGCDPVDAGCFASFTDRLGTRAWRRPLTQGERDRLSWLFTTLQPNVGTAEATQAVVAALLLAPDFSFRVEVGTPHPSEPGWRVFTDYEMATRLAYVLTDRPPDDALLSAAAAGQLTTDAGLAGEAERLLATGAAREVLGAWFAETLELDKLHTMSKNPDEFPELTDGLRRGMEDELVLLFDWVVFQKELPYNTLLTTDTTFVDRELGNFYGKYYESSATVRGAFLPGDDRGGLLGRAGILAIHAHDTQTSPTHRGKFVRSRLLCQSIPPPPEGVVTELAPPSAGGTLRDRLDQHATDPMCSGCHTLTDPIGFAMEGFDALGRARDLDNGLPIDTTGELDGTHFDGARRLGEAVAAHPDLPLCTALSLYRYANGQAETEFELGLIDDLAADFAAEGQQLNQLMLDLVLSDGFRMGRTPEGAPDEAPAELPFVPPDDDGGTTDPEPEVCNGADDDNDGAIDEELEVSVVAFTSAELQGLGHPDCYSTTDPMSPNCYAANHRVCAASDCSVTGFGPVEESASGQYNTCLDGSEAAVVQTSFTVLAGFHAGCNAGARNGPACYAAINRFCSAQGHSTGWGPIENSGDIAVVGCATNATVAQSTYTAMAAHHPLCDGSSERWGKNCNLAAHRWCVSQGHESGFGPLENSGDTFVVACVGGTP